MKNIPDILSGTPLFGGLPQDQLQEIGNISVNRHFRKGEMIFSEGDDGEGFYIVTDGRVKIFKLSAEGKEQILHIFGAGEPFGEVPVFSGESFPANAEAIADSHLLFFPRTAFVDLITANPSLALNMLSVLSMRLRQFTVQIESLSLKEMPARLAAYLVFLSDEQKREDGVILHISKGQLASLLGTIPETLSRTFAKLADRGLIKVKGRDIRLIDREGLEELAGI
ncbi:Crp/Fnr family transcriptional regulator [Desulfococcaceae bacterium HSG8]|nr:Crp/Fnr family transcriptional regulator [Desulfococcaceae bacterium HSG8]